MSGIYLILCLTLETRPAFSSVMVNSKGTNSSWGILIHVSLNTYVDIVSFCPPKSEDGQIKKGDNEGKRPDSGVDDKSSRSPKRSSELNPSWSKGGEEIV